MVFTIMVYYVQTLVLFLSCYRVSGFGSARDIITTTQVLRDPKTLKSSRNIFELGFFSPINSTNRYVGVWYNKGNTLEVVWVANREHPLNDSSGILKISADGNLQLMDGRNKSIWSSNITAHNEVNTFVAQLLDTGNFVLLSNASGNIMWQSFAHPTDTLLPRMEAAVDENTTISSLLISWKTASDPSYGHFTAGVRYHGVYEVVIWDDNRPYWRSGPWDGSAFLGVRNMYYSAQDNGFHLGAGNDRTSILSFSTASRRVTVHYVLTYDGMGFQKDWDDNTGRWRVVWRSIEDQCDYYGTCGEFGTCNSNNLPICSCLRGFKPRDYQEWSSGNWSSGCVRRTPLHCGTIGGKEDGFLKLQYTKVPDDAQWLDTDDEEDCRRHCQRNCLCLAYAYYLGFGCMIWNESLIDIKVFSLVGVDLYIRMAHSELGYASTWKAIVAVVVILSTVAVVILYSLWRWIGQRYVGKTETNKEAEFLNNMVRASGSDVEFQDLPLFKFEDLLVATNNFCERNKLGQGGFGPVYKGKFGDGQEIAVKRLSKASLQGPQEFMNEVVVISKLQHRNLVRLLGCCVQGEERLLVYEYMPNKSLDVFLFDPSHQKHLDWRERFDIIKGISRGLLYLHRDSRLRIIHRDLKASNILLDANLNPKISDFGIARIFGGNQDQGDTRTIVGTFGYMSPEYAMEGRFSGKSDVFSFGVLLLEVLSGKRNNNFKDEETLSILGQAWKLWNEDNFLSFTDPKISISTFEAEIKMCMQLGLLCVQEYPEDRPTISMVVAMIESEVTDLPNPTRPAFTQRGIVSSNEGIQYNHEHHSSSVASISSYLSGR